MVSVDWREYANRLNDRESEAVRTLTLHATANRIPIMRLEAMALVEQFLRLKQPKRILEIGTAIGWSALKMALAAGPESRITTVERDPQMVEEALKNIRSFGLESQIDVLSGDVLTMHDALSERAPYDFILIDAGKAHYQAYFTLVAPLIEATGVIICDNVFLRGFVLEPDEAPKRWRKLSHKMHDFNRWLSQNEAFDTIFVPIGDGLSVSIRKNEWKG